MNLDALFDDLEANFASLQVEPDRLCGYTVPGFSRLAWGSDHFAGFVEGADVWQIVAIKNNEPVAMTRGDATLDGLSFKNRAKQLIGLWVRVETANRTVSGRLLAIEGKLLIFQDLCLHVESIQRISLNAVDN